MEIIGMGIDIIENDRIKGVLEQWPSQFRGKVFLPEEIRYCDSKKHSFRNFKSLKFLTFLSGTFGTFCTP